VVTLEFNFDSTILYTYKQTSIMYLVLFVLTLFILLFVQALVVHI